MAIPDYQTIMAPVLQVLNDGEAKSLAAVRDAVADLLGITANDRQELIKSGSPRFDSRVHWAITYMSQAGLIRRPRRGVVEITDRGRNVLVRHPDRVDNHVLVGFAEFREFKSRAGKTDTPSSTTDYLSHAATPQDRLGDAESVTPRETITVAVEETNEAVAAELLARVRDQDPSFLERLVLQVLTAMGYGGPAGSAEQLGRVGDEGLDGVIRQDTLGLDRIYVQAKRYTDRTVGRPDIQGFVGALHGAQADRGVFITTSKFSHDAYAYAEKVPARVILIDGPTLAGLCVKHNIGVQDHDVYVLKRIDEDFFDEI